MNPIARLIQTSVLFIDAEQSSGCRAYIMKNNRTREVLVCGVWGCADTDRPASMLSAPAFIYHFGWEVSFALVSQPFNRTFITRDCSRSVACITNSTSPNNLQMESWWESLEFSSVFTSTPPFLKLQPGKILRGKINAWGKQQAHLDILMSARCSRLVISIWIYSIYPCIRDHTEDRWSRYSVWAP